MSDSKERGVLLNASGAEPARNGVPRVPLVSILIATRNRTAKLRQTLEAVLAMQIPPGRDYEVIVADNGSTDETAQICTTLAKSFRGRLRHQFVPVVGKSRAVNAAIEIAGGEILAFLDDDILPSGDWLAVICREFTADPRLEMIAGRVELTNSEAIPTSIRCWTKRNEIRSLDGAIGLFGGGNLALRRELLGRTGLFDLDLGPGTCFRAAEDADFIYRAWKAGARLVYEPSLLVYHDHGRYAAKEGLRVYRGYSIGLGAFYAKHILKGDKLALKSCYWEIDNALRDWLHGKGKIGWRHPLWLLVGLGRYLLRRVRGSLQASLRRHDSSPKTEIRKGAEWH